MHQTHQQDCIELLVEKARRGQIDRRSFLKAAGMLAALPLAMRSGIGWAQDRPVIIVNWGGDAIDAYRQAWTDSFTRETGIPVRIDGSGPTEGAIRAQLASGRPSWDVVDAEPFTSLTLGREGLMRPLDFNTIERSKVNEEFATEFGVAGYLYSYVIAWDKERFDSAPQTWADFWNVERFPGKRTMYKWMNGVLEAALLADGIAVEDLYPLDVARALDKLDELRPHILAYWGSGAESQQLFLDREVSIGQIWNTRAIVLDRDTEGRVGWHYDNACVTPSSWAVLGDNPAGAEPAMRFINHALEPEGQVELLKLLGNGPSNPAAEALIPEELIELNCGSVDNLARQFKLDIEWYADHYGSVLDQFLSRTGA